MSEWYESDWLMVGIPGEIDNYEWPNFEKFETPVCWLPHSCDYWIIGTVEDAQRLISDLNGFIKRAESWKNGGKP